MNHIRLRYRTPRGIRGSAVIPVYHAATKAQIYIYALAFLAVHNWEFLWGFSYNSDGTQDEVRHADRP